MYDSARWDGFELRDDDIVISTPPKSGTTWMQMICALLLFRTPDLPEPLATLSPWLDMSTRPLDDVRRDLAAQQHRRFIKSHTPLDGLPWDPRVTYVHVTRDPRDVALSWDNHLANADVERLLETRIASVGTDDLAELGLGALADGPPPPPPVPLPEDPIERFWLWIDSVPEPDMRLSMEMVVHHVQTFWDARDRPNVHLFHYGDLRADLAGEMARLADVLGVDPPTDELVEAATFERMRERADELAPNADIALWHDNRRFFDRARAGGWRSFMTEEDEARYRRVVEGLASPELADWLHHGRLGQGTAG